MDFGTEFSTHQVLPPRKVNYLLSTSQLSTSNPQGAIIYAFFCSYEVIFEVNLAPSVNKMLSNCDDIIRQHKAACLRVTSLLACKDLIWVGTSAGVLLTIAGSNISKGSTPPVVTGMVALCLQTDQKT